MDLKELSSIRELTDDELPQLNKLVSDAFGYEGPHTFFQDFPIWNSHLVKRLGIFHGNHLVAHAGIRFCEMKVNPEKQIPIAMIGAVSTDENFRGRGLSTKLLQEACRISEEQNCEWTLLWGSEHDFYKKFGFELHGEQFQAPLSELADLPENNIPKVRRGWNSKIFDLLKSNNSGIVLTKSDQEWVSQHQTVNWFYHEEPFAFAAFERGLDLQHIVHEYGGNPHALKEIFAYILSLDLTATVLGTHKNLLGLGFKNEECTEEYLCLARPHSKKPELKWGSEYWVSGLSAC